MSRSLNKPYAWLAGGVAAGLLLGALLPAVLPTVPVHAAATESTESFAIATGLADNNVEAIYFLDYLTGDLRCGIVNPTTGAFSAIFNYNVSGDFRAAGVAGGNAKYLMVTGLADLPAPRGGGNNALGKSIVYVAETTSGVVAAYTIQWNRSLQAANRLQTGSFRLLDIKPFRTTPIRD